MCIAGYCVHFCFKGGTFIKDRNGKLVRNQEEVLKVWEGHYSELLNQEGNMSDLELPNYLHEKVNVIEITDMEVTRGLKGMKKGEHQDGTKCVLRW